MPLSCYVYECKHIYAYIHIMCNSFKEAMFCVLCLTLEGLLIFSKLFQNNVIMSLQCREKANVHTPLSLRCSSML